MISFPFISLISYPSYRQLTGWVLPPLVVCAFGAHRLAGGNTPGLLSHAFGVRPFVPDVNRHR